MATYDYCVIGGGIVGLATARALLLRNPSASLVLLEKEEAPAMHQTSHNSGVTHAGVYYKPGSLKAVLCRAGLRMTKDFCAEHGVAHETCGKLIVATETSELPGLAALAANAARNQLNLVYMTREEMAEKEPALNAIAGLYSPETGIADYLGMSRKLAELIGQMGGEVLCGEEVTAISESGTDVSISTQNRTVTARHVVVCAGLQADRLARKAGIRTDFRIVPFRGEYFAAPKEKAGTFTSMIYPVPDASLPFLGVHFTPTTDGNLTIGPNAVLGFAREGYRKFSLSPSDAASVVTYGGFWRMARQHMKFGVEEFVDSLSKSRYLEKCRRYWPDLKAEDLRPWRAGIRAQALTAKGELVHDFLLRHTPRTLHVCNAPSPAATSALPIAEMISDELEKLIAA